MKTSDRGIEMIKKFEGCKLQSYLCPAMVWTIGYGHTGGVVKGMTITSERAEQLLRGDLVECENAVSRLVRVLITQWEFDALVSFVYNLGANKLKTSTLRKLLNTNDKVGAASEFMKWTHANGKESGGLLKRRAAEREMFMNGGKPQ